MNEQEIRTRSEEKVKQVLGLIKALHLRYEIKEHVTQDGFIEKTLFWIDEERYPNKPPIVRSQENDTSNLKENENPTYEAASEADQK